MYVERERQREKRLNNHLASVQHRSGLCTRSMRLVLLHERFSEIQFVRARRARESVCTCVCVCVCVCGGGGYKREGI